jgi:hypothetical protein
MRTAGKKGKKKKPENMQAIAHIDFVYNIHQYECFRKKNCPCNFDRNTKVRTVKYLYLEIRFCIEWKQLMICVREMPDSNLVLNTEYPDSFRGFSRSLQANTRTVSDSGQGRFLQHPSQFTIHKSTTTRRYTA